MRRDSYWKHILNSRQKFYISLSILYSFLNKKWKPHPQLIWIQITEHRFYKKSVEGLRSNVKVTCGPWHLLNKLEIGTNSLFLSLKMIKRFWFWNVNLPKIEKTLIYVGKYVVVEVHVNYNKPQRNFQFGQHF